MAKTLSEMGTEYGSGVDGTVVLARLSATGFVTLVAELPLSSDTEASWLSTVPMLWNTGAESAGEFPAPNAPPTSDTRLGNSSVA